MKCYMCGKECNEYDMFDFFTGRNHKICFECHIKMDKEYNKVHSANKQRIQRIQDKKRRSK